MSNLTPDTPLIAVCGDWHHDTPTVLGALDWIHANGISTIIQVGDFGFFDTHASSEFLSRVNRRAAKYGINIIFLDGNHEDHPLLWSEYADSERSDEGFWKIRNNIWYSPRGNSWDWFGLTLATVGGAYSIDRAYRTLDVDWFLEEEIRYSDFEHLDRADILFTHDAPTTFPAAMLPIPESYESRRMIDRLLDRTRPLLHIHGHYHQAAAYAYPQHEPFTRVLGLPHQRSFQNHMVGLDLTLGKVHRILSPEEINDWKETP